MRRLLDIQTFGIITVITAHILAELSAWLLMACPSCGWAWYLNLGPFKIFEIARASPLPLAHVFAPASLPVAIGVLACILFARQLGLRLVIAFAANLSFGLAAGLAYVAARDVFAGPASSRLEPETLTLVGFVLTSSFAAFVASHASFIASIVSEKRAADRGRSPIMLST